MPRPAYGCKLGILAILNAACRHIIAENKYIWMHIMVSTTCQVLHHILSVKICISAICRYDLKLMLASLQWECTAQCFIYKSLDTVQVVQMFCVVV